MRSSSKPPRTRTAQPGTTADRNPDPDLDPEHEVTPGQDPEVVLTAVPADLDHEVHLIVHSVTKDKDLEPDQGEDLDLARQTYQSDVALHHFWKKGESQVQENDPFHTDARGSVMTAPLPRVLTVHTPDLVDLIQDPHAQGPVLVRMNAISGYHGQEAGVDHQFIHHEKRF